MSDQSDSDRDRFEKCLRAAEAGDRTQQYELAVKYKNGDGVAQDFVKAAAWFREAAQLEHYGSLNARAVFELVELYAEGKGVERNEEAAGALLDRALASPHGRILILAGMGPKVIENRAGRACLRVAEIYEFGRGVTADPCKAAVYYRKAAETLFPRPVKVRRDGAFVDEPVPPQISPEALERQVPAFGYYRRAAALGDAEAQFALSRIYAGKTHARGHGTLRDDAEAVAWLRKSAEQGYTFAQYALGLCYAQGQGVGQDEAQAAQWLRKAADPRGEHGNRNDRALVELLRCAPEQLLPNEELGLGLWHEHGRFDIEKDEQEALRLYGKAAASGLADAEIHRAAMNGDAEAQYRLGALRLDRSDASGVAYRLANWSRSDFSTSIDQQARELLRRAAAQGHAQAQLRLTEEARKRPGLRAV